MTIAKVVFTKSLKPKPTCANRGRAQVNIALGLKACTTKVHVITKARRVELVLLTMLMSMPARLMKTLVKGPGTTQPRLLLFIGLLARQSGQDLLSQQSETNSFYSSGYCTCEPASSRWTNRHCRVRV